MLIIIIIIIIIFIYLPNRYFIFTSYQFHILFMNFNFVSHIVCMNPFLHCSLFSKWDNGGSRFHIPLLESEKKLCQPKYLNFSLVRIWTEYRWGNHQIRGKHLNHCAVEALLADCNLQQWNSRKTFRCRVIETDSRNEFSHFFFFHNLSRKS